MGSGKKYRKYSTEYKLEVIQWKETEKASYRQTQIKYGIPSNETIKEWEQKYSEGGLEGLKEDGRKKKTPRERGKAEAGSQEALLQELEYLRAENAYLKKLRALVQEEEEAYKKRG